MIEYFQDSTQEMKKVTWPTKNQAIRMTFLVIVVVIITALVIALLDYVFGAGSRYLIDLAPADSLPTIEEPVQPGTITVDGEPIAISEGGISVETETAEATETN
ncbi:preprotein translocase subunit SecE [Pseudomonadota bacterium]